MKSTLLVLLVSSLLITSLWAQKPLNVGVSSEPVSRVSFTLRNTLGYHRMFRAEGPGMAYGFTMNRNESTPKNWPLGSKLYFSNDGETNGALILTVTADDAGKTLKTDVGARDLAPRSTVRPLPNGVTFKLHNASLLPRRIALITYVPGEQGNGTSIFMMRPKGNTKLTFPVGTRLYLASNEQVKIVMSGSRIDSDKPFLTVKRDDQGGVFDVE
jgi:hypothetical protein